MTLLEAAKKIVKSYEYFRCSFDFGDEDMNALRDAVRHEADERLEFEVMLRAITNPRYTTEKAYEEALIAAEGIEWRRKARAERDQEKAE